MVVAVSTSEPISGTPEHTLATERFALVKFLIELALEEVIVELASLILASEGKL
jgi:hypothetical protein